MKISLVVCNVCQDPKKPTRQYRVASEGRSMVADLCKEDGAPIEQLFEKQPTTTRTRRQQSQVTSMEEIERLKNKGTKKP
ncbi:hypothetical protein [Micromonospora sp. NPDC048839]|uniref:hypothetical protein n=1 Tax=Micromonospora sp. NPDC048839 TaxID=3155641 RepID=UPI0033F0A4D2